jgi:hypothetical protein
LPVHAKSAQVAVAFEVAEVADQVAVVVANAGAITKIIFTFY